MAKPKAGIRHVAARATRVVLVCRKCSKKLGGGFGEHGEERLAKSLRRAFGGRGEARRAQTTVVEVGCLDLCPKGAVAALRGDRPDDWLVVPAGTPVDEVGRVLGLHPLPTTPAVPPQEA